MSMEELGIVNDMPKGWFRGEGQPLWHQRAYRMWKHLWNRCRNPKSKYYEYYKDCDIYEDFRYLSKFVAWLISELRFEEFCNTCDKVTWNVDKDMKCLGNRNYYPEFMTLTTQSENTKEMLNRKGNTFVLNNPNPKIPVIAIDTKNNKVLLFESTLDAQNKGFNRSCISECINKKQKTHKGCKWYKLNYKHNLILRRV